jgi:hypothetical protein
MTGSSFSQAGTNFAVRLRDQRHRAGGQQEQKCDSESELHGYLLDVQNWIESSGKSSIYFQYQETLPAETGASKVGC